MQAWFAGAKAPSAAAADRGPRPAPATLLVLQEDAYDWPTIFTGSRLRDGRPIRVVQTGWEHIGVHVDTYSSAGLCVEVTRLARTASLPEGGEPRYPLTVRPDFVLIRNEVRTPLFDGRSRLSGLMFADVPSLNSLESVYMMCDRPAMQGQLHKLHRRLNKQANQQTQTHIIIQTYNTYKHKATQNKLHRRLGEEFPVMPQHFASTHRSLFYGYTFPAVVKVGSAHAGAGKMKIIDHRQMSDFRSVLAMMPEEHCLVEPFVVGESDLRIQRIGEHYRAFRRVGMSGDWKTNTGCSLMEEVECSARWRRWVHEAASMFGGLDIFAVDAITEDGTGQEHILEVNGTSIGLHPDHAAEDNLHIRDLALAQMNAALCG